MSFRSNSMFWSMSACPLAVDCDDPPAWARTRGLYTKQMPAKTIRTTSFCFTRLLLKLNSQCLFACHGESNSIGLVSRSEEHTSELQSRGHLVCRLLLEKKN